MNPDIRFLIDLALRHYDELPLEQKASLMRGVSAVCPPDSEEAATANQMAWHLQRLDHEQLRFKGLLQK